MSQQINTILELIKHKNIQQALIEMKKIYESNSQNYDHAKLYAYLLMLNKEFSSSEKIFSNLKNVGRDDYDIYNNLGHICIELEKFSDAESNLMKAISIYPDEISAYANFGALYLKAGEYEKGIQNYKHYFKLIGGEQNYSLEDSSIILGYLDTLVALGNKKEAKDKIKIFLEKKFNEEIFYYLVNLDRNYGSADEFNALYKQYSSVKEKSFLESSRKYAAILFSMALYYENKDQRQSEKYYYEGNQIIANLQRFKPLEFQNKVKNIKSIYNKFFKDTEVTEKNKGEGLIFIVGLPRSGTTLLESIIANNPSVKSGGELMTMMRLCSDFTQDSINTETSENQIKNVGDEYLSRISYLKKNSKFFLDKLPGNYFNLGFIASCLPGSKFILVRRNFWDVAISQFKQFYISNIPYSSKFFNIAIECANFEHLVNFWESNIPNYRNKVLEINYENLVANEQEESDKLYAFIGIKGRYSPTNREKFFSRTASRFQVQGKVHQSSVQKSIFESSKNQFFEDFESQRNYWTKN